MNKFSWPSCQLNFQVLDKRILELNSDHDSYSLFDLNKVPGTTLAKPQIFTLPAGTQFYVFLNQS